MAASRI